MKIVSTLCAALLLSFSSKAQFPQTFNGAFNGANATNDWSYTPQTSPITASSCAAYKTIAGAFTTTSTTVRFDKYLITNTGTSAVCMQLNLTPACSQAGTTLLLTVFKGAFDADYGRGFDLAAFTANYLGDAGSYSASPTSCSIPVGVGQTVLVVVNTNGAPTPVSCNGYTLTATAATVAPLPVSLVSFKGRATPTGNALEWTTASEQGNLGFAVERSTDGQNFGPIGWVPGAGTRSSASTYGYLDATPASLSYYRLRQQDVGGGAHFSPVVAVQAAGTLSFFPNPVVDEATFGSPVATRLTVRDALGRVCRVLPLSVGSQQVSLAALPAGVYAVTNEATHQTMRLVKANQP